MVVSLFSSKGKQTARTHANSGHLHTRPSIMQKKIQQEKFRPNRRNVVIRWHNGAIVDFCAAAADYLFSSIPPAGLNWLEQQRTAEIGQDVSFVSSFTSVEIAVECWPQLRSITELTGTNAGLDHLATKDCHTVTFSLNEIKFFLLPTPSTLSHRCFFVDPVEM